MSCNHVVKLIKLLLITLQNIIEKHWYKKNNIYLFILLMPYSWLFFVISKLRFYAYHFGILSQYKLPIPLVIVGNISVGGVGKTPFVIYLIKQLQSSGISVGVILRGYKGSAKHCIVIDDNSSSEQVGDEAMIYHGHNIPVAIAKKRYDAGINLIACYPHLQLIISDDGLQHYRLYRDYEIIIIDETRMFGNGYLLPCGPLRESIARIKTADTVILNQIMNYNNILPNDIAIDGLTNDKLYIKQLKRCIPVIGEQFVLQDIYNPKTTQIIPQHLIIKFLENKLLSVMVATGNPERFIAFLKYYNINPAQIKIFQDHYYYTVNDIDDNCDIIFVTEKDYTKLNHINNDKIWVVRSIIQLSKSNEVQLLKNIINLTQK